MKEFSRFVVLVFVLLSAFTIYGNCNSNKYERLEIERDKIEADLEAGRKALGKELEDLRNFLHVEKDMSMKTYLIRFLKLIQEETESKIEQLLDDEAVYISQEFRDIEKHFNKKMEKNMELISKKLEAIQVEISKNNWNMTQNRDVIQQGSDNKTCIDTLSLRSPKQKEMCPDGWIKNPETKFCYYFGKRYQKMNFTDAVNFCQLIEAMLLYVHTEKENDFIESQIGNINYWLGLSDSKVEGIFEWTDGSIAVYTDFQGNEPNDQGTEDCTKYWGNATYLYWNDVNCNDLSMPICKRPTISIPQYDEDL